MTPRHLNTSRQSLFHSPPIPLPLSLSLCFLMLILKFHIPLPVHAQLKQPQKSVASVTAANEAIKYQQDFKGLAMRECYKGERKSKGVGEREGTPSSKPSKKSKRNCHTKRKTKGGIAMKSRAKDERQSVCECVCGDV